MFIHSNELVDIGFTGQPWTWSNDWEGEGEIRERLDRVLCSRLWAQKLDKAVCSHVSNEASDHAILLLETNLVSANRKKRFLFDIRWIKHGEVEKVIAEAWS
ncbi:hypothetical protein ACH5RR_012601 [Cinchona calisaya]|uniref:Reverse transcriptase n=1 Tax=Cinchona calisaya TaxID=153742 RepID=A0ABD3A836_9GENT